MSRPSSVTGIGTARAPLPRSRVVDTTASLHDSLLRYEHAVTHSHGTEGSHSHEGIDGHTWLDPINAIADAGLMPILEPEYDIKAADRTEGEAFLRGCLLDGRNSLRDQAARAVPEVDREHHKNWENLIMTSGQPDAWGMAAYSPVTPAPSIYRRATMASVSASRLPREYATPPMTPLTAR